MSNIKQLVKKQIQENLEVEFKAESTKATFILEDKTGIDSITLTLHSNGSKVYLGSLFENSTLRPSTAYISNLELIKGEKYSVEFNAAAGKAMAKIGVVWGE